MTDTTSPEPGPQVQPEPGDKGGNNPQSKAMWARLLHVILVAILASLAQTVLNVMAVVQFIIMATGRGKPNDQIAHFGKSLGDWLAKAARFQTASSEDKPWPWSPLG